MAAKDKQIRSDLTLELNSTVNTIVTNSATTAGATFDGDSQIILDDSGNSGLQICSGTTSTGHIFFGDSGNNAIGRIEYDHSGDDMKLIAAANTVVWVDGDNSRVSIGTGVAPNSKLEIKDAGTGTNPILRLLGTTTGDDVGIRFNSPSTNWVMGIDESVGADCWQLTNGTALGTNHFRVQGAGGSQGDVSGYHGTYHTSSDERLKENFEEITDAVDKCKTLRAITYDWKKGYEGQRFAGLIAQDVHAVLPEAIHIKEDEQQTMSIMFDQLSGLYIAAIKELAAKNEELEARLAALES